MQTWQANLAPRFTAGLSDYSFFQNWAVRGKSVKPKSSQIKRLIGTMHHNFSNCSSHRRGIDWGKVDLVIQIGSPKGIARFLQRIGRSNHRFNQPSRALLDNWAEELVETGYLHNHARMWFASIWIFTLELPWRLGADFFYRNFLDGDPASNTLGWRWVAGLHTRGKPYYAQAWNIAKFTDKRFNPRPAELAEVVEGLESEEPEGLPGVTPIRTVQAPDPNRPTVLLISEEDCRPEDFDLSSLNFVGCATLAASHLRSPRPVAPLVEAFERGALIDTASRIGLDVTELRAGVPTDLARWASRLGVTQIATSYIPTGPLRDWIFEAMPSLEEAGIDLVEWRRDWDSAIWPHATAGFFKVKKQIPATMEGIGLI